MKKVKFVLWLWIMQMMAASIIIYGMDKAFAIADINLYVGINPCTLGFVGVMGIPGVIALFILQYLI